VFERFTTQGRAAVALAVEEGRSLGHAAIGTEHLLLGLLRAPETEAAQALFSLGVELSATRSVVRRILGWGEPSGGEMPFTAEAQRALRLAVSEASRWGEVGPDDILRALVAEPETGAALILLELGATPGDVRGELEYRVADVADPARLARWPGLEEPVAEGELEVGWRGRGIALAALGAAVLGRSAFDARRTGPLMELEMQLLVWLALGLGAGPTSSVSPGEAVQSLPGALACDRQALTQAIEALRGERLVIHPVETGEDRVAITTAGVARVEWWLARVLPLFGSWPPEYPGIDDATG